MATSEPKNKASSKGQTETPAIEQPSNSAELSIQKIYVKDLSVETPHTPTIFKTEWQPEVKFELSSDNRLVEEDLYEVVLRVMVTATIKTQVAFLVEVQQAGVFTVKNFPEDQRKYVFGSVCPSILFPYAREAIASSIHRAGFPQLDLAPINFDAVYAQHMQRAQSNGEEGAASSSKEPTN